MQTTKKRNQSLDLVKIIAMLGVVALHCQLYIPREYHSTYILSTLVAGFPIPLFFMVSGYLMLKRQPGVRYCAKKVFNIIRFLASFALVYWLIFQMAEGASLIMWPKYVALAMLQKGPLPIFWYFGAMCILYACLPLIVWLDRKYDKFLLYFTALLFVVETAAFIGNCIYGVDQRVDQSLRVWNWFFYFCLGGLLAKYSDRLSRYKVTIWHIMVCAVLYFVIFAAVDHYIPLITNSDESYGSIPSMLYSLSIFVYCLQHHFSSKIITTLSPLFLPVYSLHLFVYDYYFRFVNLGFLGELSPLVDCVLVAFATISISYILMRIPFMDKFFKI